MSFHSLMLNENHNKFYAILGVLRFGNGPPPKLSNVSMFVSVAHKHIPDTNYKFLEETLLITELVKKNPTRNCKTINPPRPSLKVILTSYLFPRLLRLLADKIFNRTSLVRDNSSTCGPHSSRGCYQIRF